MVLIFTSGRKLIEWGTSENCRRQFQGSRTAPVRISTNQIITFNCIKNLLIGDALVWQTSTARLNDWKLKFSILRIKAIYINLTISLIIKKISKVLGDSLSLNIFKAKLISSKREIQIKETTNKRKPCSLCNGEMHVRLSHGPSCLYKQEMIWNNITDMLVNLFGEIAT